MVEDMFLFTNNDIKGLPCDDSNIYCFSNNYIVAIDSNYIKINKHIIQEMKLNPYYLSSKVFKEFINKSICFNDYFVSDLDINDYEEIEEYLLGELKEYLHNNKLKQLLSLILDNDIDIDKITIRFQGYDFSLTSEGILTIDAPKEIVDNFIKDTIINLAILGT